MMRGMVEKMVDVTRGVEMEMGVIALVQWVDLLVPNERVSNGPGTLYPAGH